MSTNLSPLDRAIEVVGGQVTAFADRIEVRPNVVFNWKARGKVPSYMAPIIERVTGVAVEVMCPDEKWRRIPDKAWPNPAGRPVIDPAGPAPTKKRGEHSAAFTEKRRPENQGQFIPDRWKRHNDPANLRRREGPTKE